MPRHTDWARVRITPSSDPVLAASYVSQGRLMLGDMLQGLALVDQQTGVLRRRFQDGTVITVSFDGTTPTVTIDSPPSSDELIGSAIFNLWVPRGFLVYPAWTGAAYGVGLPIIPDGSKGPYDPVNLAPGLPRARWTPGGPCGEVLISQDKNAGYAVNANDIAVPLFFDPTKGPVFRWPQEGYFDARATDGEWTSYRMELAPFVAHYADEDVESSQSLFEAINAYRSSNGLTTLNLQPRGLYDAAQVMVSIMQAAGTDAETASGYPATYMTTADRLTKDGYGANLIQGAFATFNRGDNPTSFEVRSVGGGADDALSAWKNDATANASLLEEVGKGAFGDVGYRGGWWAANIISRTSWLQAGNAGWQSSDPALPYVSWHSFASVNLAWETYPAQYDAANYQTIPLVITRPFTDSNGDCWIRYPRSPTPKAADIEPALSRHIYMRGRSIAVAPNGGLVWGASLIAMEGKDRLVALVHHPVDQTGDATTEGFTRYLRVWWADIPNRAALRADPQLTICGEDATDTWSWRGGQILDVGSMPAPSVGPVASTNTANSLKYASCWRFSSDGTRAICLRDYASLVDYQSLYSTSSATFTALNPRAVEIAFNTTPSDTTASLTFHDYTANASTDFKPVSSIPGTNDVLGVDFTSQIVDEGCGPIAVDYGSSGTIEYFFQGGFTDFISMPILVGTVQYNQVQRYVYVGKGPASCSYYSDLSDASTIGCSIKTRSLSLDIANVVVMDIGSETFAVEGVQPRFGVDGHGGLVAIDTPCFPFTEDPVHAVNLYRYGVEIFDDWYAAPDGTMFCLNQLCFNVADQGVSFVELMPSISRNVQGHHSQKNGDYIFGYQLSPVPLASRVLDEYPADSVCGCRVEISQALDGTHWMADSESNPIGGRMQSSVPLPDADWLIYSKVL